MTANVETADSVRRTIPEAALRDARQLGITGEVEINHTDSHTIRHSGPSDEAA